MNTQTLLIIGVLGFVYSQCRVSCDHLIYAQEDGSSKSVALCHGRGECVIS